MRILSWQVFVLAAIVAVGCASSQTEVASSDSASAPPYRSARGVAEFVKGPLLQDVKLSPDARHIAAIVSDGPNDTIVVRSNDGGGPLRPLAGVTRDRFGPSQRIRRLGWASNEYLAMVVGDARLLSRVNSRQSHLFSIRVSNGDVTYLAERWPDADDLAQGDIISYLPDDPDHVLVNLWFRRGAYPSPHLVDVRTGTRSMVEPEQWGLFDWYPDHQEHIRVAEGASKPRGGIKKAKISRIMSARIDPKQELEEIIRWDPFDEDGMVFASYTADPAIINVFVPKEPDGRRAVKELDLRTKKLGKVVFDRPGAEPLGVVTSRLDDRPLLLTYVTDRVETYFLDPEWESFQRLIDEALPGRTNAFTSRNADETMFCVVSSLSAHRAQDERRIARY